LPVKYWYCFCWGYTFFRTIRIFRTPS